MVTQLTLVTELIYDPTEFQVHKFQKKLLSLSTLNQDLWFYQFFKINYKSMGTFCFRERGFKCYKTYSLELAPGLNQFIGIDYH
jgi:hypothetical protein